MKNLIALMILAIGMLVMWPPGDWAKASASEKVSFVADIGHAGVIATVQENTSDVVVQFANVEKFEVFELAAIKPEVCTAENVVQKSPDFNKFYLLNYRTCLHANGVRSQNKFLAKNKVSIDRIRIRDDTSV